MGKAKAVIRAIIGIPCLLIGAYFFLTMFVVFFWMLQAAKEGPFEAFGRAIGGYIEITISGIISGICLFVAYVMLRGLGKYGEQESNQRPLLLLR